MKVKTRIIGNDQVSVVSVKTKVPAYDIPHKVIIDKVNDQGMVINFEMNRMNEHIEKINDNNIEINFGKKSGRVITVFIHNRSLFNDSLYRKLFTKRSKNQRFINNISLNKELVNNLIL